MVTVNGITTYFRIVLSFNTNIILFRITLVKCSHTHNCILFVNLLLAFALSIYLRCNLTIFHNNCDQALDLLVSVSSVHYCTSTPDLSTLSSTRGLTNLCYEISYLEASFTLICFQRLSFPFSAIRLCFWRNNRCTVGTSTPVLAY